MKLGFDRDHLLIFRINPLEWGFKGPEIAQVYEDMLGRIRAVPGVKDATVSINGLFSHSDSGDPIEIEGYTPKSGQDMDATWDEVGPNYFSAVGIPILMGRDIEPQDGGNGQRVGVINQTMARYYFGEENPIGRRIVNTFPANRTDFVVVGVAADAKYNNVREKTPRRFYVPFFNPMIPVSFARVEVRAAGDPSSVAAGVREAVRQTSSRLPPVNIQTLSALVSQSLTRDTMLVKLSGFFGGLAVLLACVGIYGVMAYAVANRTNEIGVRMALGAQPGNISSLVLRESMILVVIGAAIGLPLVFLAEKLIASLLFGLSPADPASLILATILMFGVAGLAGYLPARRAARVDPMIALRYE